MNWRSSPTRVSAAIYGGISAIASLGFFTATTLFGDYTWVARIGGALWVLLLSLIITMPTVTPRVHRRFRESASQGPPGHSLQHR